MRSAPAPPGRQSTVHSLSESAAVRLEPGGINLRKVASAEIVTGPHARALNTFEQPGVVRAQAFQSVLLDEGKAQITLPPLSVAAVTFGL